MSRSDSPPIAGTSDPLVTLASSTGRSAKSTTKRKTLAPLWKESFSLPADFGGPADFGAGAAASTESDASGCKLELTIFAGKDLVAKDGGMFSKATSDPWSGKQQSERCEIQIPQVSWGLCPSGLRYLSLTQWK